MSLDGCLLTSVRTVPEPAGSVIRITSGTAARGQAVKEGNILNRTGCDKQPQRFSTEWVNSRGRIGEGTRGEGIAEDVFPRGDTTDPKRMKGLGR